LLKNRATTLEKLADSPFLWFLLFGLMALAALVVVGPKFARRQSQLRQNYEGRREAWQQRIERESRDAQHESENPAVPLNPADTPSGSP
jgi:hypothetical protein